MSLDKEERLLSTLPSPCWLLDENLLEKNLKKMSYIKEQTGVKILLALKGYALWNSFWLVGQYLDGCCASGLHEAKLSSEKFEKETHTYSPAFKQEEIQEIAKISNHLIFNSRRQLEQFAPIAKIANADISLGIRVNPEVSSSPSELYNPCAKYSRLGVRSEDINDFILNNIEGLHFHALCAQGPDSLALVLESFEEKFKKILPVMKWVNFGGGHHITKEGYDIDRLISIINEFQAKYPNLQIYLEPGEAVGWHTGTLMSTVLDIVHNEIDIAILDTSSEAHMPDTIIMPYRPEVEGGYAPDVKTHTYRLSGNTCLAGDIMGDYSFEHALQVGDIIIFKDQMHYTMVKSTTFNGIALPAIAVRKKNGELSIIREFEYEEYKSRLS